MTQSNSGSRIATVAIVCTLLLVGAALAGCSASAPVKSTKAAMPENALGATNKDAGAAKTTDAGVQVCSVCAGKGMAPMVKGAAVDENGVQVVKIGVKDGYYSPNEFMVKAGTPVKVVFTGKAKGCLAKPRFNSLGKGGDFTSTGTVIVDLGDLKPGTHEFKCGMGMNGGKIVAQ